MEKNNKIEKLYILALFVIVAFVLGVNILKYNITSTDDGYLHLIKIIGVSEIINTKQFPPIIMSGFCHGYAINLFYNPFTTYISLILGNIFTNYALGIKLMLLLMLVLSMFFMYYFMKTITKRREISIVSAIFYVTGSYYLSNIYIRGAIGESAALAFLPLLFLGIYNLFNSDGKKHYFISIGAIGLLLTHNITTLFAAIICMGFTLININKFKETEIIKKVLINVIFIIGITLFFLYPLGLHKIFGDYVVFNSELMRTTGSSVSENVIGLKDLFIKTNNHEIIFNFNLIQLILFLASVYCIKYVDKKYKKLYIFAISITILCSISSVLKILWLIMPDILCIIQFPWRLLGFSGFFMSVVSSINLIILLEKIFLKNNKENNKIIYIAIPIAMMSLFFAYKNDYDINIKSQRDEISTSFINENINNIQYANINREYLPSKTYRALYMDFESVNINEIVVSGNADIVSEEKNDLKYKVLMNNVQKNTVIEVPFLYYYGYKAYLKGDIEKELKIRESEYGFLEITIPKDIRNCQLIVEYETPMSYYVVYIISLISTILFIIYIFYNIKKNK